MTINFLRSKLRPFLSQHGVQEITDEKPAGLKNSNVAIVVSHGKLGWGNRFSAVTDNSVVFSPQEITSHLADAGCVVFFVCHAGKSDLRLGSLETAGLASEMLKGKARAVIASPWSLHIDVAVLWLPVFLQHLREGSSVGQALHAAAQTVRAQFANPCAWAALQLFGDPCFIPESKATPAA